MPTPPRRPVALPRTALRPLLATLSHPSPKSCGHLRSEIGEVYQLSNACHEVAPQTTRCIRYNTTLTRSLLPTTKDACSDNRLTATP